MVEHEASLVYEASPWAVDKRASELVRPAPVQSADWVPPHMMQYQHGRSAIFLECPSASEIIMPECPLLSGSAGIIQDKFPRCPGAPRRTKRCPSDPGRISVNVRSSGTCFLRADIRGRGGGGRRRGSIQTIPKQGFSEPVV